jgi:uncharacterized protein
VSSFPPDSNGADVPQPPHSESQASSAVDTPALAPALPPSEWTPNVGPPTVPESFNVAWNGWDVLRILLMAIVFLFGTVVGLFLIVPGATVKLRADKLSAMPEALIVAQMVAYVGILGYMYILVKRERGRPRFWESIHWNWPANVWPFVLGGLVLQGILVTLERFLPFPSNTPFEALLQRPWSMLLIAAFSVTLGPLMEELFFRAFLYPVLARRVGAVAGIGMTAAGFALMHAAQYGYSWASVLLIMIVGLVLGAVRERQNSVAAGFLVHVAYNGTIVLIMLAATNGFRHLDKLSR